MESKNIAGGIFAALGIAVPATIEAIDLKVPPLVGNIILGVCAVCLVFALYLFFKRPKPKPQPQPSDPRRDVCLSEALAYAIRKQWGLRPLNAAASAFIDISGAMEEARQLASDGELTIWGKQSPHGIYLQIPPNYWHNHRIEWFDTLRGEPRTEPAIAGAGQGTYWNLMASRAQFEKNFPR